MNKTGPREPLPPSQTDRDVRDLLRQVEDSDRNTLDRLYQAVYHQIGVITRQRMASAGAELTINTTGLVHES